MEAEANGVGNEVFVYMGAGGPAVPMDVVRSRVHPSVTVIPDEAFQDREKLEEIEFCEGIVRIGERLFNNCKSLKRFKVPSTVTAIGEYAFADGIFIGQYHCSFL